MIRYSIVLANFLIVGLAGFIVIAYSDSNAASYNSSNGSNVSVSPLDDISAADIAVNIARMTNLPEANSVVNYADTINSEIETFTANTETAKIPQILTSDIKTLADIQEYITVPGDTVSSLATKFGVTSDSIKWSNDLTSDNLEVGIKVLIPPMNGMIYTVRSGDTPEKISGIYQVPIEKVVVFNDVEISGLIPGKRIFLPNAQRPAPVSRASSSFSVRYGDNGYDAGWCTYYAAARGGAPPGWGNARTWASYANKTPGWFVSKTPVPGAIAQTTGIAGDRIGGSWGHVGVVEQVKEENGQIYIKYSDMNGIAGFNKVGHSEWVPALEKFQNFIYRVQ